MVAKTLRFSARSSGEVVWQLAEQNYKNFQQTARGTMLHIAILPYGTRPKRLADVPLNQLHWPLSTPSDLLGSVSDLGRLRSHHSLPKHMDLRSKGMGRRSQTFGYSGGTKSYSAVQFSNELRVS